MYSVLKTLEGRPEVRVAIDSEQTDSNTLLRNMLDQNLTIINFGRDQRHLNEAFMDLTERGVRT